MKPAGLTDPQRLAIAMRLKGGDETEARKVVEAVTQTVERHAGSDDPKTKRRKVDALFAVLGREDS